MKTTLILMFLLTAGSVWSKQIITQIKSPEATTAPYLYLQLVVDKDNKLVVASQSEIPSGQCDIKTEDIMISLKKLRSKQVKALKCNLDGAIRPFYHLDQFVKLFKMKSVKKIYLEPVIIPYLHQSTPSNNEFAKIIDRFVRKNELIDKTYVVSNNMVFLRTLKGRVNKEHKIIFKNGSSHPNYLHLALYYNLHGVMPHYQWIYNEDLEAIKKNDKRIVEVILWGEISPFIREDILKKPIDGILNSE